MSASAPRSPHRKGRPKVEIRTASLVLAELLTFVHSSKLSYTTIAKRAGISKNAPTRWARGVNAPSILSVEAIAKVLGFQLKLERLPNYVEEIVEQKHVTISHQKRSRSSGNIFTRTNRGANGKFVPWPK